jgi:hypothetical protein
MKRIFFAAVLGLSVLLSQRAVNAQNYESYGYTSPRAQFYSGPVYNYPRYGGWGGWGYHSSTYEQGVLMGLGELYRGVGEYNVANSVAAYNWQLARNANLQNNVAERAARSQMYASVRAGQARRAEENKKKNEAKAKWHAAQPIERLTSNQINRETGEVRWPSLLTQSEFDANRGAIEEALAQKFQPRQVSTSSDDILADSINELQQKLENSKDNYRPSDYYAARGFLIRLKQEVSETIPAGRLAASF